MSAANEFERAARREESTGASRVLTYGDVVSRWYKQRWDPYKIPLDEDAATFSAAPLEEQQAIMLPTYHRVKAEDLVAGLMNNLVLAAPSQEAAMALATQQSDEDLHVASIVRVCEEVYGIEGGVSRVLELADKHKDPATEVGFMALRGLVEPLGLNTDPEDFLRSSVGYHWISEGGLARTSQLYSSRSRLMAGYPGTREGQKNVQRDEARHIQIGVIIAREALDNDYAKSRAAIMDVINQATGVLHMAMEALEGAEEGDRYLEGYGVTFKEFAATAIKFIALRLKSAGLHDDALQIENQLLRSVS